MNPTQLRTLFDTWIRWYGSNYQGQDFAELIAELIEAAGFPYPPIQDLFEARGYLSAAQQIYDSIGPDGPTSLQQDAIDRNYAEYEKRAAEWTVTS